MVGNLLSRSPFLSASQKTTRMTSPLTTPSSTYLSQTSLCPLCKGAKRVLAPDGDTEPCPECWAPVVAAQRIAKLWAADGLPDYARMTFDGFHGRVQEKLSRPDLTSLSNAKKAAIAFASNPIGFIVFSGPLGCGKTHLAAAIANEIVKTRSVIFLRVVDFLDYLRRAFDPDSGVSFAERFDAAKQIELLVLDDLGAEHSTPWVNERLFSLLDDRYMRGRPTVITTNLEISKLPPRLADRLGDSETCQVLAMYAPSMRPVKKLYATLS